MKQTVKKDEIYFVSYITLDNGHGYVIISVSEEKGVEQFLEGIVDELKKRYKDFTLVSLNRIGGDATDGIG